MARASFPSNSSALGVPFDDDALSNPVKSNPVADTNESFYNNEGYELKPLPQALHSSHLKDGSNLVSRSQPQPHPIPSVDATTVAITVVEGVNDHSGQEAEQLQARYRKNGMIQFAALCWLVLLMGWNDGTTGPLLPRMQHEYGLGYLTVSLIFVGNGMGHITGAALNIFLTAKLGFGKTIALGSAISLAGYVIMSPGPPFPVLACSYYLIGLGMSLQNAQGNGFLGSLKEHMSTKLGIFHGIYGLGAFLSPFASTAFSTQPRWSFFFLISTGLQLSNLLCLVLVFRLRNQDDVLADAGQEPSQEGAAATTTSEPASANGSRVKEMFKLPALHLLAIFAVIYVGVEVTLGGWIVTFIIRERSGGSSSGYISSGFFGGLALGRVALIWFNRWVGEERVMYLYSVVSIVLELTIWFVPSIIQNAIAVSVIGLLLGPMFPIIISHSSRILPRWMLTACVGWITGIAVSGSAALPFITGVLASSLGIRALQPLMVSMLGAMLVVWACVPKVTRRMD
ncbi:MFS transporter [Coprinopsis cinerea AmutBmut pab1-1]|nr:MFS transporter [Coprinopsis cinerea AmutBmut pab1-1]